ncbi:MAG: hypothetical protein ACM3JQ_00725 [Candidatus Eiseniibacteriota bacterium]
MTNPSPSPSPSLQEYEGKSSAYDNFKDSLRSEQTVKYYTYRLNKFLKKNGLDSPDKLLSFPPNVLEDMIRQHTLYLVKEAKSNYQTTVFQAALKHFCRMNKMKGIDWDFLHQFNSKSLVKKTKYNQDKDDAYSHEQIQKLLSVCNLREKAIVLIYASTGIRLSGLPSLKIRHIE